MGSNSTNEIKQPKQKNQDSIIRKETPKVEGK